MQFWFVSTPAQLHGTSRVVIGDPSFDRRYATFRARPLPAPGNFAALRRGVKDSMLREGFLDSSPKREKREIFEKRKKLNALLSFLFWNSRETNAPFSLREIRFLHILLDILVFRTPPTTTRLYFTETTDR